MACCWCLVDPGVKRPRHRWLLIGPPRSGSEWHMDPWASSAWNLLIDGRKRWALYPPGKIPPSVQLIADPSSPSESIHVECCSALRWFLEVLPFLEGEERPLEFVQHPGETVFVPQGWWHCVLNLDLTVSVTQNFIAPSSIDAALHLLSRGAYSYYSTIFPVKNRSLVKQNPLPTVETSWIGSLARGVWSKRPDLRMQLWRSAEQHMHIHNFKECLTEICERHKLPPPQKQDAFPVWATSNLLFRIGDYMIKLYIHENPLNLCIQQLLEASALSAMSQTHVPAWENCAMYIGNGIIDLRMEESDLGVEVPYLVSTFVVGQQLSNLFKTLDPAQLMEIAAGMGRSVARLHNLDVSALNRQMVQSADRLDESSALELDCECGDQDVKFNDLRSLWHWVDSVVTSTGACFQAQDPNRVWSANMGAMLSCKCPEQGTGERRRIPEDFMLSCCRNEEASSFGDWFPFLAFLKWRHTAVLGSPSITNLPEHLLSQLQAYLPDNMEAFLPSAEDASHVFNVAPAILHGDLTNDNVLIALDDPGNPAVVDFGDVCHGDPLYDFVSLSLSSFRSNSLVIEAFARDYFEECKSQQKSHEFWKLRTGSTALRPSYIVMCYCILHEDDTFGWLFKSHPEYTEFKTLNQIEMAVWGPLNDLLNKMFAV